LNALPPDDDGDLIMLLLALSCERTRALDEQLVEMLMSGDLSGALRVGMERLERSSSQANALCRAEVGRLLGRALLAADRAEDAEELFQRLVRDYESLSRGAVRWYASLDQAVLALHVGRPGRAAEAWNLVADDEAAPTDLRIEAMAGLAQVLLQLGEHRRAALALRQAGQLAEAAGLQAIQDVVAMLEVELAARCRLVTSEGIRDYALIVSEAHGEANNAERLVQALETQALRMVHRPLAAHGLAVLQLLVSGQPHASAGRAQLGSELRWLHEHGYRALEEELRIMSALALLAREQARAAMEVLGPLGDGAGGLRGQRHGCELLYCQSRAQVTAGCYVEALRTYKDYARESLYRTIRERALVPRSRFVERALEAEQGDAAMLRLPLRYRRAYRYIIERLADSTLSIRQVAAHIDVTERALQAAFRKYLGMTPGELIRHRRLNGIRNDLLDAAGTHGVLDTAARWGMAHRTAVARGYRRQFSETPAETLGVIA
jgi:AraC-like DNA-binding protein